MTRITIITEEELTHKVLASFCNDFAVSGLGRSLKVFLNEGVNTLVAIPTITDLDWVTMLAKMNTRPLISICAVDVEDFGNTWCNALGGSLQILHTRVGKEGREPPTGKGSLVKASNSVTLTVEV